MLKGDCGLFTWSSPHQPGDPGGAAMTDVVNLYGGKTNLSKLVDRPLPGKRS
jgi:hypothetical protein